ncbi:MAG: GTPase [Nitrospirae bacterium]|nr:GTPase [Nitrospirota bacterium]MCL5979016.1 GTPase [Nitrospirota bacterium]
MKKQKIIIMGAAGRDFHNFNILYRDNPEYEVIAFTAAQIPFIEERIYPSELTGRYYPDGIPIYAEEELDALIAKHNIDQVIFSYSDVSHEHVMHKASQCLSLGADFVLPGPEKTMLKSNVPVISVCAVRTGCGKSIITKKLANLFKEKDIKAAVIRHPMPYCDFVPAVKFSTIGDIDSGACTIEEREEFEPLVERGITVYAGVDYEKVLEEAEKTSEIIIWDGGNNDLPFIKSDLEIVLIDALRPGHERLFYPGEVNLKRADILVITKTNEADASELKVLRDSARGENKNAEILEAPSILTLSDSDAIKGKKVLVIEDGPSITHGGMPYGAGIAASKGIVSGFIDPRPYSVGSIKETYERFPHIGPALPAIGYSDVQIKELEETISRIPCDAVVIATPVDLRRIIKIDKPTVRVSYDFDIDLSGVVKPFMNNIKND